MLHACASVRTLLTCVAVAGLVSAAGCSEKKGLSVTGIEPNSGPHSGNTTVTIRGTGFQDGGAKGVKVYFGGQEARVLGFVGDDVLKVDSPAGDIGKAVDVVLVFDNAKTSEPLKFTYLESSDQFNVDALVEGGKAQASQGAPSPASPPK